MVPARFRARRPIFWRNFRDLFTKKQQKITHNMYILNKIEGIEFFPGTGGENGEKRQQGENAKSSKNRPGSFRHIPQGRKAVSNPGKSNVRHHKEEIDEWIYGISTTWSGRREWCRTWGKKRHNSASAMASSGPSLALAITSTSTRGLYVPQHLHTS